MMVLADLPPQQQEQVACAVAAGVKYEVPANVVLAIRDIEHGKPGQRVRNTNGTEDIGQFQFNSAYVRTLAKYGISEASVAVAGCYPYDLAAWRLRQHFKNDKGDFWTKAANYHSYTPEHNARYRGLLIPKAAYWADWLEKRFTTRDIR